MGANPKNHTMKILVAFMTLYCFTFLYKTNSNVQRSRPEESISQKKNCDDEIMIVLHCFLELQTLSDSKDNDVRREELINVICKSKASYLPHSLLIADTFCSSYK